MQRMRTDELMKFIPNEAYTQYKGKRTKINVTNKAKVRAVRYLDTLRLSPIYTMQERRNKIKNALAAQYTTPAKVKEQILAIMGYFSYRKWLEQQTEEVYDREQMVCTWELDRLAKNLWGFWRGDDVMDEIAATAIQEEEVEEEF
ncbi:hypothetical protein [Endozoicomonas acroporae]|uniref:hypothetical protein n=1 Tax=Endozoicomonas acroporae TaxID=1701104 RepID=UPI003D79633D